MDLFGKLKKRFNQNFLTAVCAACALVAYADGEVTDDEVEKMMSYMKINKDLRGFNQSEITKIFQHFVTRIGFDFNIGKSDAFSALEKISPCSDHARKVCEICIAVAKADGKFEQLGHGQCEIKVIRDICSKLGVRASEFGI
jgi:tellurite resistance protein TerB